MIDYADVLTADPNTKTITITAPDGSAPREFPATVSLGVEQEALQDAFVLARDTIRLDRTTADSVSSGERVAIPGEPAYEIVAVYDQPRTGSTVCTLALVEE